MDRIDDALGHLPLLFYVLHIGTRVTYSVYPLRRRIKTSVVRRLSLLHFVKGLNTVLLRSVFILFRFVHR